MRLIFAIFMMFFSINWNHLLCILKFEIPLNEGRTEKQRAVRSKQNDSCLIYRSNLLQFLWQLYTWYANSLDTDWYLAATTLTGLHFATTTTMTLVFRWLGYIQPTNLPVSEILKFVLFANFSIVGMNISLMWNSVGFYQVSLWELYQNPFAFLIVALTNI